MAYLLLIFIENYLAGEEHKKLRRVFHKLTFSNILFVEFKIQWSSVACYYKCFTIVIYDRNDIGLHYKTRDDRNWLS